MRVNDKTGTIQFDHVSHKAPDLVLDPKRIDHRPHCAVFLVQFDGEWDLWFSQCVNPTDDEIRSCLRELELYYHRDWKGTKRVLPVIYTKSSEYHSINCI